MSCFLLLVVTLPAMHAYQGMLSGLAPLHQPVRMIESMQSRRTVKRAAIDNQLTGGLACMR